MPIIKFPTNPAQSPFFKDIIEEGYHIFSLKNAKKPNFYPNEFPDYPGVKLKKLKVGDKITVRVFFKVGTGEDIRADGGYIDLEVEDIFFDGVNAVILTELPKGFSLATGDSIDVFEEEILYRNKVTDH
jgi:hypothetical protein